MEKFLSSSLHIIFLWTEKVDFKLKKECNSYQIIKHDIYMKTMKVTIGYTVCYIVFLECK